MKIVIVNSFYYPDEPGGAERSVRILAESLVGVGHDVSVICLGAERATAQIGGVAVTRLPIRNSYLPSAHGSDRATMQRLVWHARDTYNSAAAADVAALLHQFRPDVLHTNNLSGFSVAVWRAARQLGIRIVHTTRDFYLLCPRTTMMRGGLVCEGPCRSCFPFVWHRRNASSQVDHLVGISQFMVALHRRNGYFRDVPATVIYNPYDPPSTLVPPPTTRHAGIVLGYLGRLAPSKGLELLIDAFMLVNRRHAGSRLLIAGSGANDYVTGLQRRALDASVEFVGQMSPENFFPMVDVTVVPSVWNEPLGRVVIESFAFARPVVATPVGGIPELIRGAAGTMARSTTADDLASAISAQIGQDASIAREAAAEEAKRFTSRVLVDNYDNVYRGVHAGMIRRKSSQPTH